FGAGKYSFESAGQRFNHFSTNVFKMVSEGKSILAAKRELFDEVSANFESFFSQRDRSKPFCYWFGPTNVHRRWAKGSGKKIWGINADRLEGKLPPFLPDVPEVREDVADYLGEIQAFDQALGLLVEKLVQIGEWDNTVIVVSGDHGPPGFPHGKCNLYDFGSSVSLAIRGPGVKGSRVVDDLISLTDLAPTFLELAQLNVPSTMTGKSLVGLLKSATSGQVELDRKQVFIGRERHVDSARSDYAPYPQRAIRTHEFLYIINFHPERWPLGDPYRLDESNEPTFAEIALQTRVTLADDDAGPTKAWLVTHRKEPSWKPYFDRAFGRRPQEELYDLKLDPHQMNNVAEIPTYSEAKGKLKDRLLNELQKTADPRMIENGKYFETPPLSGPAEGEK
ncbi:MAG: sulfatase, partial [Planctomycetes bacterium]|nr:sulfatase [Planctomycetota bacterium]